MHVVLASCEVNTVCFMKSPVTQFLPQSKIVKLFPEWLNGGTKSIQRFIPVLAQRVRCNTEVIIQGSFGLHQKLRENNIDTKVCNSSRLTVLRL